MQKKNNFNAHLLALFLVILNVGNYKITGFSKVMPLFDIMAVFYFSVFFPIFSTSFIFLLGVFSDALQSNFLGVSSLIYILLIKFFLALNNRMIIAENFRQILQQFALFLLLFLLFKLAIISLLSHTNYDFISLLIKWILSIIIYAAMHRLFDYFRKNSAKNL